jgi:hypothetical protein
MAPPDGLVLGGEDEQDAEDEDGVDEVLADLADRQVRLADGHTARPRALRRLGPVEAVERHSAEPDDRAHDVEQEQDPVEGVLLRPELEDRSQHRSLLLIDRRRA